MYLDGLDELDQKIIRLLYRKRHVSLTLIIGEETGYFQSGSKSPYPGFGEKRRNRRIYKQLLIRKKKSVGLYHAILKLKQNRSTWRR